MSYWLEIHCDGKEPDGSLSRSGNDRCQSFHQDNPGVMMSTLALAPKHVEAVARQAGWTLAGKRWLCPYCAGR